MFSSLCTFIAAFYAPVALAYNSNRANSNTGDFTLPSELAAFIPACVRPCFLLFLENNYPSATCTNNPSLSCLCSHASMSGFTIGEGALQCIAGAIAAGICSGDESGMTVGLLAYNMCAGQTSAIPNTHPTITATQLAATGPSVVTETSYALSTAQISTSSDVQPTSATSSTSASITQSSTAVLTRFSSSVLGNTPTTATLDNNSSLATSATASPSQAQVLQSHNSLAGGQVAGIAIGSLAGFIAIIGIILFFWLRHHRKKEEARDSGSFFRLPYEHEKSDRLGVSGFRGPTEQWTAKAAPPIRERDVTVRAVPNSQARRLPSPTSIGLAISSNGDVRDEAGLDHDRRRSALLPPRPGLEPFVNPRASPPRVKVPQSGGSHNNQEADNGTRALENDTHLSMVTVFDEAPQDSLLPLNSTAKTTNTQLQATEPILTAPAQAVLPEGSGLSFSHPPSGYGIHENSSHSRRQTSRGRPPVSRDLLQHRGRQYHQKVDPANHKGPSTPPAHGLPRVSGARTPASGPRNSGDSFTSIESDAEALAQPMTPTNQGSKNLSPVVESPRTPLSLYPPIPGTASSPSTELRNYPKPLFYRSPTKQGEEVVKKPGDLAVYDAFWRPRPQTQNVAQAQQNLRQSQILAQQRLQAAQRRLVEAQSAKRARLQSRSPENDLDRQRQLRMSRATYTSQPQAGHNQRPRTGKMPVLPRLHTDVPVPTASSMAVNYPSAVHLPGKKGLASDDSIMQRARPNADYVHNPTGRSVDDVRGSAISTKSTNTTNTRESGNSLTDRRGTKAVTPINVHPMKRHVKGDSRSEQGIGGSQGVLLSPRGRNVTPRKIGDALYLEMS